MIYRPASIICQPDAPQTALPPELNETGSHGSVARPFTLLLKIPEEGAGFKASGDGVVKLSAYGIEQPSQFGVKTTDDVQLHFEFAARPVSSKTAMLGGMK